MGASGIFGSLVDLSERGPLRLDNLAFLAGLIGVPAALAFGQSVPATHLTSNIAVIVIGGLAVGLGTRLANGCTSGHGVCGISRLSNRGIMATVFYLLAGFASVYLFRHVLGVI